MVQILLPDGSLRYPRYALIPPPSLTPGGSSHVTPPFSIPAACHASMVSVSFALNPNVAPFP